MNLKAKIADEEETFRSNTKKPVTLKEPGKYKTEVATVHMEERVPRRIRSDQRVETVENQKGDQNGHRGRRQGWDKV